MIPLCKPDPAGPLECDTMTGRAVARSRAPDAGRRAPQSRAGARRGPEAVRDAGRATRRWSRSPARPAWASARCTGTGRAGRISSRRSTATTSPASPRSPRSSQAEQEPWDALVQWLRDYLQPRAEPSAACSPSSTPRSTRVPSSAPSRAARCSTRPRWCSSPRKRPGVVRADLTAADLVQLVSGMVLPALTDPSRNPYLLDVVLDGIRA